MEIEKQVSLNLTEQQVKVLLHLVTTEMDGICGDLGYADLSKIKKELQNGLEKKS